MYIRELETDAAKHAQHIANLMQAAAKRMQTVKAKMKLKKEAKSK